MESLTEFVFSLVSSAKKIFSKDENSSGDAVDGESKQKTVIYGKNGFVQTKILGKVHFRDFHVTSARKLCINWHLGHDFGLSRGATCTLP